MHFFQQREQIIHASNGGRDAQALGWCMIAPPLWSNRDRVNLRLFAYKVANLQADMDRRYIGIAPEMFPVNLYRTVTEL